MKVLMNCNSSAFQAPGGGEILLLKNREYLIKKGLKIKLFNQWKDKLTDYDLLHNFGLSNNCYDLINTAYNKRVPIAITPIYAWPSLKSETALPDGDNDGMPDAWEKKNGLNNTDGTDAQGYNLNKEYTNIETYLNSRFRNLRHYRGFKEEKLSFILHNKY